jgi:hypothetical protein
MIPNSRFMADDQKRSLNERHRRGTAIIEVGVAMTLAAVIAGVTVGALVAVKRVDQSIKQFEAEHAGAMQLADRLRHDVHQANSLWWQSERSVLILELAQGEFAFYACKGKRWERRLFSSSDADVRFDPRQANDEQFSGASLTSAYRLSPSASWDVPSEKAKRGETVHVQFYDRSSVSNNPSGASFVVTALLGRDQWLTNP